MSSPTLFRLRKFPLGRLLPLGELNAPNVTPLHGFSEEDPTTEIELPLWLKPIPHPAWPEQAMVNHVVLGGKSYVDSITAVTQDKANPETAAKRIQIEAWTGGEGGEKAVIKELHAFAEVVDPSAHIAGLRLPGCEKPL